MILNYFDIGDIFYDSCEKSLLTKMQTLENNALRCVYLSRTHMSIQKMHEEAGLLPLSDRRKLNQCTLAHKLNIKQFVFDHLKHPSLRSNTRITLTVPKANSQCFDNSFVLKSIKLWNNMPEHHKHIPPYSTKLFKIRVRKEINCNKTDFPE